jgi:hypothetical protein
VIDRSRATWGAPPLVVLFVLCTAPLAGQTSNALLELPASVRSVALNGAATAIVGDASAVFANPAGLATISHIAVEGAYRRAPGEARLAAAAFGWRLRQFDVGFGLRTFEYGTDPARYLGPGDAASVRDVLGAGSVVYRFGLIALGATVKYERRTMDHTRTTGLSGDAGLAIAFFDIMALAFSVENVGGNWRDTSSLAMPRRSRLGFTMNYVDPQESFRLTSIFEVQWPEGRSARAIIGGEAGVVLGGVGVIGRLAYGGGGRITTDAALTVGGSVRLGVANLDYAYRDRELLGQPAHYIGLRLTL